MAKAFFTFEIVQAACALKSTQGWKTAHFSTFPDVTFATLQENILYCPEWRFGLYTTQRFIVQMTHAL